MKAFSIIVFGEANIHHRAVWRGAQEAVAATAAVLQNDAVGVIRSLQRHEAEDHPCAGALDGGYFGIGIRTGGGEGLDRADAPAMQIGTLSQRYPNPRKTSSSTMTLSGTQDFCLDEHLIKDVMGPTMGVLMMIGYDAPPPKKEEEEGH